MIQADKFNINPSIKSLIGLILIALILLIMLIHSLIKLQPTHQKKPHQGTSTEESLESLIPLPITLENNEEPPKTWPKLSEWITINAKSGDTLGSLFKQMNLSQALLQKILQTNPHIETLTHIKLNQKIKFLIRNKTLEKMILSKNHKQYLVVTRNQDKYRTELKSRAMAIRNEFITATIKNSLYETAKQKKIPYQLIYEMTKIFNWQIDFSKDVRTGDHFSMVYKGSFIDDELVEIGEILAVTYVAKSRSHTAIRHINSLGFTDYFTPEGVSLKKAFSRYPLRFSHISSTFNMKRKHPILHYVRPHLGIDLAAPIGTPIHATGDGRIEYIGRRSGYGNMVKLSHSGNYSSIYAHMLKFQQGLRQGMRVKRDQIIGYVGQSGLATAPHCHYEFHIKHQPQNPSTVAMPQSEPLRGKELAQFNQQAHKLLAQLKVHPETKILATSSVEKKKIA